MNARCDNSRARPLRPRRRRAHTLLEVVLSVGVTSIIMGAVTSTMMITSRALSKGNDTLTAISDGSDALQQISADLSLARSFSERTETAVTFTVPDRDGDAQPETIRYAWSGTAGDPLTRQYNDSPAAVVAKNVHHFSLDYLVRAVLPAAAEPAQESDEMSLMAHDNSPGGRLSSRNVTSSRWCGQFFRPAMPTNVLSWKITRVMFRARSSGRRRDGQITVQITETDADGKPTDAVLAEQTVSESNLKRYYQWVEVSFPGGIDQLDPLSGYCVVVRYGAGTGAAGAVEYEKNNNPMTIDAHWLTSNDRGKSWTAFPDDRDMRFYVYGTVTTEGEPKWP